MSKKSLLEGYFWFSAIKIRNYRRRVNKLWERHNWVIWVSRAGMSKNFTWTGLCYPFCLCITLYLSLPFSKDRPNLHAVETDISFLVFLLLVLTPSFFSVLSQKSLYQNSQCPTVDYVPSLYVGSYVEGGADAESAIWLSTFGFTVVFLVATLG